MNYFSVCTYESRDASSMNRLDKVIDIFVTDKPIALLFDSNTYLDEDEVEKKKKMRVNSIFEIFNGDKYFYPDWFICYPKMVNYQKTNLYLVVKNILSRGDPNSVKPLENISTLIDTLRDRITSRNASEADYLLYLRLIALISEKIKNNQYDFSYEIHVDDDGINPSLFNKPEIISSDDYNFEYLQALLSLLSYYTSHRIKSLVLSEILNFSEKCICIINEIYSKCTKILNESDDGHQKFVYKNSPSSMSSLDINMNDQPGKKKMDLKQLFINHYLGGLSCIKAHLHLFEAKRYEILYSIQMTKKNDYLDSLTNLMYSIGASYNSAFKSSKEHNTKSKLTGYTRFMAQLWLCETNYFIASSLEKDIESDHQIEAFQRSKFIRKCYNTYRDEVPTTFLIGPILKDRYTKVIVQNDQLYQRLVKTTTYVNDRDFSDELTTIVEYTPLEYNTLSDNIAIPLIRQQTTLNNGLGQLNQLLNSIEPRINVNPELTREGVDDADDDLYKNTQFKLFGNVSDLESFKVGILNERKLWLTYLTENRASNNDTFIINTQEAEAFRVELDKTIKMLELHSL